MGNIWRYRRNPQDIWSCHENYYIVTYVDLPLPLASFLRKMVVSLRDTLQMSIVISK